MKLTLPQQDVYFEQLLYPNAPICNIGAKIEIHGSVEYSLLNEAYIALINQHDAYRSIIVEDRDEVCREVVAAFDTALAFKDFSARPNPPEDASRYMQATFTEVFDFGRKAPLHKFELLKVGDSCHYLFSMYHHIITDGWGTSLMFQRLVRNYNELAEHGRIITEYPYSYESFVLNDQAYVQSKNWEEDKAYWKEKFRELPGQLFQKIQDQGDVPQSRRRELVIGRERYNQLNQLAKANRCSAFHVILGALYLYFGRKRRQRDFAIGVPTLNRENALFKKTVGLFMGVTPLRIGLDYQSTFTALLHAIRDQLRKDYRHQRFPTGKLIQELGLFQQKERLFNITLSYEKQDYADHFAHTKTRVIPLTHQSERVALAIYIREFDESEDVRIDFDYNLNYFDEAAIAQVTAHFEQLIHEVCLDATRKLEAYTFITAAERVQLLQVFNPAKVPYLRDSTLLAFFAEQVRSRPSAVAVADQSGAYTYQQLDARSERVATGLHQYAAGAGKTPVAVLMPRCADMVAVFLGIMKSGRAYIPLDPSFPQERLDYIVAHSGVCCIIGQAGFRHLVNAAVAFVTPQELVDARGSGKQPRHPATASDTAYIIYTSGSTGNPKGVAVGHGALLNFLLSMQQNPKVYAGDRLFSVTTPSFDISILEFFLPLISGASLYVASEALLEDPLALVQQLREQAPTLLQATPSFYQMLFNAGWQGNPHLKVLCGGDLLSESLAGQLLAGCPEVWNMYGPTETTIWSSCKRLRRAQDAAVIGSPINNTRFYILDDCLQLLPAGSIGNIYIGGDGLAQGYYKNDALTNEKFIPDLFGGGGKMYNTGDLGRWTPQGEIEFLGRNDHQVKIRGYRIELDEIETRLNEQPGIKTSVVVARKNGGQEAYLAAYVVTTSEPIDVPAILDALRKDLPEYMIPYVIVRVESFPLTPNKKVDRKALALRNPVMDGMEPSGEMPANALETRLCAYFREILDANLPITTTDNFFALGGHSLNAVKLINCIEKDLSLRLSLKTVFDYPTVKGLAGYLTRQKSQAPAALEVVPWQPCYALAPSQYPIWLASQQWAKSIAYHLAVAYEIEGPLDVGRLESCFLELIEKFEVLRTSFVEVQGVPRQQVRAFPDTRFRVDLIECGASEAAAIRAYTGRAFDLANDLLLRSGLFRTASGKSYLVFCTHHLIMDGWSLEVLTHTLTGYYNQLSASLPIVAEPLDFQYKDYATWQHRVALDALPDNGRFWGAYLRDYGWPALTDRSAQHRERSHTGATHRFAWPPALTEAIKARATQQHVTLHTFLITAFNALLHKLHGYQDICIGTVNSGRTHTGLQAHLGMFVKTLPLRVRLDSYQYFPDLLGQVQRNLLELDAHQDVPAGIQDELRLDILFVLQNPAFNHEQLTLQGGVRLKALPLEATHSMLPLVVDVREHSNRFTGMVTYDTGLYEPQSVALLLLKFEKLLECLTDDPGLPLNEVDIELAFEKEAALDLDFSF